MQLIKLDAIDSTNDFLKALSNQHLVEDYTVVTAENQTNGKGQMGSTWVSEKGKNLIMSILIKNFISETNEMFNLNIAVSMAVIQALEAKNIPKLSVKWPNDIMSDSKKIGGILIENIFKSDTTIISIVGLGLNVNQTNFESLSRASSLAIECNSEFDREEILYKIVENIKENIDLWNQKSASLWMDYTNKLFKKGMLMTFQDRNLKKFMGIIQGVSLNGRLQVLQENDTITEFDIKEIQLLY